MADQPMAEGNGSPHWQGCWRADGHHECAVHLLDLILREDTIGEDEARRLLHEAKVAAGQWETECEEFGCHDDGTDRTDMNPTHSNRTIRTQEGGPVGRQSPASPPHHPFDGDHP